MKPHRHDAGMPFAALRNRKHTSSTAGNVQPLDLILDPYEEELVTKPERQVLQERWVQVGLEPAIQGTLRLCLDMTAGRLPAACELLRGLMHLACRTSVLVSLDRPDLRATRNTKRHGRLR